MTPDTAPPAPAPPSPAPPAPAPPAPAPPSPAPPAPAPPAPAPPHPTSALDDTVHQRHRLGILTIVAEAQRAEFGYLREALELTAGNLSRHLTVLEEAGLVTVEKGYSGRRPRTWVRITAAGRSALSAEIAALTALLRRLPAPPAGS